MDTIINTINSARAMDNMAPISSDDLDAAMVCELQQEAGQAGDTAVVDCCTAWLSAN